jgi:hypothetical protein
MDRRRHVGLSRQAVRAGARRFVEAIVVYVSGSGAEHPGDEARQASWLVLCVRILPPVTAALVLKSVFDWGDGLLDWLKVLGLTLPLSVMWGAALRLVRPSARERRRRRGRGA